MSSVKNKIKKRIRDEMDIREIEHDAYMEQRKTQAKLSGKEKGKKKKDSYLKRLGEKFESGGK